MESLQKRFEEYTNEKLNEFCNELRKKMEELSQMEMTLRFVTAEGDTAVPVVTPTGRTSVCGNELHQETLKFNLGDSCLDWTVILPKSRQKPVQECSGSESVMTTIDMTALTDDGLKRKSTETPMKNHKRLRKQVWSEQVDDEVTGRTVTSKRDYAVKMVSSCKSFSTEQIAVMDGRKELIGQADKRCYWCLSFADDDIKPFIDLQLLSTVCCGRWICRECLETGVRHWKQNHRTTNRVLPCLFCRPPRKTVKTSAMIPPKNANRAQCGYAALFWLTTIETLSSSDHCKKSKTTAAWLTDVCSWLWEMNTSVLPGVLRHNLYEMVKGIAVGEEEKDEACENVDSSTKNYDEVACAVQTILPDANEHDVTDGVLPGVACIGNVALTILPQHDGTERVLPCGADESYPETFTIQVDDQLPPLVDDVINSEELTQFFTDLHSSFPLIFK